MNILSFSGFIPEQVCDTVRFIQYGGDQRISHYCGYAADYISQVLDNPQIDGAVFPRTCDSSRSIASYLGGGSRFVYQMHIPARRDGAAVDVLRAGILRYKEAVERHYGMEIMDIPERCMLVNERNRELAGLYGNLEDIPYGAYLEMVHTLLQTPLRRQNVDSSLLDGGSVSSKAGGRKRVFLIGSQMCGSSLAWAVERAGMKIVGDRLPESRRLFSAPAVEPQGDVYGNIARSMLGSLVSPTQDSFREIILEDREEIRRKQADGVIFVTQKYCEPYGYLFPVYKKMLDGLGIPVLRVELADSSDGRKAELSIETFAGIL